MTARIRPWLIGTAVLIALAIFVLLAIGTVTMLQDLHHWGNMVNKGD